jgi:predicted glycoside hydrolase/deacetylase ChbG (UPF0249 family)
VREVDVAERILVVNADDFGLCPGVNRGIIAAHERGIVTSTSLMVRWPAAAAAAAYARSHSSLGVGLHLDLGEWIFRDGEWVQLYEVVPVGDAQALATEVDHQLAEFRRLLGREPTHLDSHQHLHRDEPLKSIAQELAGRLSVPLRHFTQGVGYCGDFYGQTAEGEPLPGNITADSLIGYLERLPRGVNELACHPGEETDDLSTMYRAERPVEVKSLCDPRVREAIDRMEIRLCSFEDVQLAASLRSV